jgi:8-oxo-dGTP diphosphatase
VDTLHFAATVDNIRRDEAGRVRFHYTIIDFATRWVSGEPVAASDVTEAVWARLDTLDEYNLWSEAHRVIAIARRLVGHGGAPKPSAARRRSGQGRGPRG